MYKKKFFFLLTTRNHPINPLYCVTNGRYRLVSEEVFSSLSSPCHPSLDQGDVTWRSFLLSMAPIFSPSEAFVSLTVTIRAYTVYCIIVSYHYTCILLLGRWGNLDDPCVVSTVCNTVVENRKNL